MRELTKIRKDIDKIDKKIAKLLTKRMNLSKEIKEVKRVNNMPLTDLNREKELLNRNLQYIPNEFKKEYSNIFESILKESKNIQSK